MSARLLYVMDPMCSWCWGFAPVMQALAEQAGQAGVPLSLRAGGLRPWRTQALDAAMRDSILAHWHAVHARSGQPFRHEGALPEGFTYDTEPACRALVVARELAPGSEWALAKAIQQAFYQQGRDVSQASVLLELAVEQGLPRQGFAQAFDGVPMRDAVREDFDWVARLGISGFPTLLAQRNGQLSLLTNGYQSLEVLSPLLGRWLERGNA